MDELNGKQVAVLVDNYFEQAEFIEPVAELERAGADVTIIGTHKIQLRGLQHARMGERFKADLLLDEADAQDYDALVLPGGAMNADSLRMDGRARRWAQYFLDSGKPLAVICHAPWVLVSARLVKGKRLTSYYTIQDDIRNAGGDWVDEPVVIDDNLITSRQPDDLPQFSQAIIDMLSGSQPAIVEPAEAHHIS